MNRLDREWAIKLDLMESIARSQQSLADMLEHAAASRAAAGLPPAVLREHVRVLNGLQAALLAAATSVRWQKPRRGAPGFPWLEAAVCPGNRIKRRAGREPQGAERAHPPAGGGDGGA